MSTLTTNFGMTKPATTDGVTGLRTAIGANADILDPLIDGHLKAYRHLVERGTDFAAGATAGTYQLGLDGFGAASGGAASDGLTPFYFDLASHAVAGRTTKCNLRGLVICTTNAPGISYTLGLYPVTIAGTTAFTFTLGTVVSGSTVAINTPSASLGTPGSSGDFTPPASGLFAIGVVLSGTQAAGTKVRVRGSLEVRNAG